MSDERRYSDEEVQEIFGAAAESAEPSRRALPSSTGLTLAELQEIGREVGLPPERIAKAASLIDIRRSAVPRRTYMGAPISVGRAVDLARAPTDHEWELLVSELRTTFNARGRVESVGNLRSWTNGNLHVYVEPTDTGHQLRMRTEKGGAVARIMLGIAGVTLTSILVGVLAVNGELAEDFIVPGLLGTMSLATLGSAFLTLPRWALEREQQMEHIAARAQALIGAGER